MSDDHASLADFSGTARLFPLPNLVLFPHVMQPLHIFEPRYRQMTADALAGDRLIALALLLPGWEADYDGKPAIHPVACLGRIVAEQQLEDGRFNILLRGVARVRIRHEFPTEKLYRSAQVELLQDQPLSSSQRERDYRRRITKAMKAWFHTQGAVLAQFRKLLKSDLPLGVLGDIITFALPLDLELKQEMLEDLGVEHRLCRLLEHLENKPEVSAADVPERKFPPDFSAN